MPLVPKWLKVGLAFISAAFATGIFFTPGSDFYNTIKNSIANQTSLSITPLLQLVIGSILPIVIPSILAGIGLVYVVYGYRKSRWSSLTSSNKEIPSIPKPDSQYEHLVAHLFWPEKYYTDREKWPKDVTKGLTSTKAIVNTDTMKAFHINDHLASLIRSGKIQHIDEVDIPSSVLGEWAVKHNYTFFNRYPKEEELQKGNNNSTYLFDK